VKVMRRAAVVAMLVSVATAGAAGCAVRSGAARGAETSSAAGGAAGAAPQSMEAEAMVVMLTPEEQQLVAEFDRDVASMEGEMADTLELSAGPDCGRAAQLAGRICELADRICDIADRHPDYEDVTDKCSSGRQRCEQANASMAEGCGG